MLKNFFIYLACMFFVKKKKKTFIGKGKNLYDSSTTNV